MIRPWVMPIAMALSQYPSVHIKIGGIYACYEPTYVYNMVFDPILMAEELSSKSHHDISLYSLVIKHTLLENPAYR